MLRGEEVKKCLHCRGKLDSHYRDFCYKCVKRMHEQAWGTFKFLKGPYIVKETK